MDTPRQRRLLHIAKIAFAAAVAAAVAVALVRQWGAVRAAAAQAHPRWGWIVLSSLVVLANYALLIEAWRTIVAGWGGRLSFTEGARIWSISNLGRYVPGKVWQMGTMAVMAQERGVSGIAAAGAAVINTLINTVAGFVVLAGTGASVLRIPPVGTAAIVALGVGLLLAPRLLPWLAALAGKVLRRELVVGRIPHRAIWLAALISAASWIVYGLAFRLLAVGVLGRATGAPGLYVAVFTGSYLAGFLALIVPGGLGVREVVMATALRQAGFGTGEAILLVVASRIWLTILEIVPAILFMAHRWVRPRRSNGSINVSP
ncbi:MAG TPA: lysylphosphatidylglycerol synthase domain-containing protein [Gemmatimonadaceae bacterium]|nr:lysylphosphatidylglycerol synthase domain-containing protein [Gemmatimonadaceae bacterium]